MAGNSTHRHSNSPVRRKVYSALQSSLWLLGAGFSPATVFLMCSVETRATAAIFREFHSDRLPTECQAHILSRCNDVTLLVILGALSLSPTYRRAQ